MNKVLFCSLCNITCLWIRSLSAFSVVLHIYRCGLFLLFLWYYLSMIMVLFCSLCNVTCLWIRSLFALSVVLLSLNVVLLCSLCDITCLWMRSFSALCNVTFLWIRSLSALSVMLLVYGYDHCLLFLWYYISIDVVLFCSLSNDSCSWIM